MTKRGDVFECGVCGIEVSCTKDCGCGVSDLVCCGKPMKRKRIKSQNPSKRSKRVKKYVC